MHCPPELLALPVNQPTDHSVDALLETVSSRRNTAVDTLHLPQFPVSARNTARQRSQQSKRSGTVADDYMTSIADWSQFPVVACRQQDGATLDSGTMRASDDDDDDVTSSVLDRVDIGNEGELMQQQLNDMYSFGMELTPSWIVDGGNVFRELQQSVGRRELLSLATTSTIESRDVSKCKRWCAAAGLDSLHTLPTIDATSVTSDDSKVTSSAFTRHDFMRSYFSLIQPTAFDDIKSSPNGEREPRLELETADLWRQFHQLTTEMVITKSGRFVN